MVNSRFSENADYPTYDGVSDLVGRICSINARRNFLLFLLLSGLPIGREGRRFGSLRSPGLSRQVGWSSAVGIAGRLCRPKPTSWPTTPMPIDEPSREIQPTHSADNSVYDVPGTNFGRSGVR